LAKNIAGASAYGEVMGRQSVKNGYALGRQLYLGHGTRATPSDELILADEEGMQLEGFDPYCKDPLKRPPMEDSSALSKQTRAAGIAFAVQLCLTASSNFMRNITNRRDFQRSVGASSNAEVTALNSGVTMDDVMHFIKLPSDGVSEVLNMKDPGRRDLFGRYLEELSKQSNGGSVAFQQTGYSGFDFIVVPLAQETVSKIGEACQQFHW
jgi:hypothetical protein